MKKVLILSTLARQFYLFEKCNINVLKKLGCEIHVAANDKMSIMEEVEKLNVKFHLISIERSPYSFKNVKAFFELKKLVKKYNFDFIHCHSPVGGVLGRIVGKLMKIKVIYTAHGFHFYKGAPLKNWIIYYSIEKFLSKYTDILITINNEDKAISERFKAKKNIYIPGIGLNIEEINNINIKIDEKKEELGIMKGCIVLLSVGELSYRKNHEVIIEALSKIKTKNFCYFICGEGELRKKIEQKINEYNLENKIFLLGYRRDIKEIMKVADIFVFPSLQEGLPVALMEAMASGLPVVCSKIRGNTDLVSHNENGYLIGNNDITEYRKIIELLINDENLRKKLGNKSKEKIKEFDKKNIENKMEEIYKEIMIWKN